MMLQRIWETLLWALRRAVALAIVLVPLGIVVVVVAYLWIIRPPLRTDVARLGSVNFTISANGRVASAQQVDVAAKVDGRVVELTAKEGDLVRAGQVLARLEDRELRARLHQAESAVGVAKARLDEARSGARRQELEEARAGVEGAQAQLALATDQQARAQRLFDSGVAPRAELDDARRAVDLRTAQVKAAKERLGLLEAGPRKETVEAAEAAHREAQATLEYVRAQLQNLVVPSPMSGRVIAKFHERGQVVRAGEPLYTVADSQRLLVRAEVDETDLGKIRVGLLAIITADAFPGRKITGTIDKIAWRVGRKRIRTDNPAEITDVKVLEAEIPIEATPDFPIGMGMEVRIATGKKDRALLIPRVAVARRGPSLVVSVVAKDGKVEDRPVQLGAFEGKHVEVVAGLAPGEAVVVGGAPGAFSLAALTRWFQAEDAAPAGRE